MARKPSTRKSKASIKDLPLPAERDVKGGVDLAAMVAGNENKMEVMLSNVLNSHGKTANSIIQNMK